MTVSSGSFDPCSAAEDQVKTLKRSAVGHVASARGRGQARPPGKPRLYGAVALILALLFPVLSATMGQAEAPRTGVLVHLHADVAPGAAAAQIASVTQAGVELFPSLGIVATSASSEQLRQLHDLSAVVRSIEADAMLAPALTESADRIGATTAHSVGETGAGTAVVVIDTGVEASHPFIAGSVAHEACFTRQSCPNGGSAMTGTGSAIPCLVDGCSHGTHVAGIISGKSQSMSGIAPDTQIIAIQVFSTIDDVGECGSAAETPCARARTSDVLAALEHVNQIRDNFPIVAVNLSLSGDDALRNCDRLALRSGIDQLRSVDIVSVAAAGNGGSSDGLGIPACVSSAISVGATYSNSDTAWSLSNSSSELDFWAPGVSILSATPGGGFETASGTSAAAPHVAAAWALASARLGTADVDTVRNYLVSIGTTLKLDAPRVGTAKRIDLRSPQPPQSAALLTDLATSEPVSGDFDNDGRADLLWYGPGDSPDELWFGNADGSFQPSPLSVGGAFAPITGDFDGDGADDIFWTSEGSNDWIWFGQSNRTFAGKRIRVGDGFTPFVGDFDGDQVDDVFWNGAGKNDWIWYGQNSRQFSAKRTSAGDAFSPIAGDYNGDGADDIFWNADAGDDWIWYGQSNRKFTGRRTFVESGFVPFSGDFNGDGRDDIFWNAPDTNDQIWYGRAGLGAFDVTRTAASGPYRAVTGDYNGDGVDDILWNAAGSGDLIWFGGRDRNFTSRSIVLR